MTNTETKVTLLPCPFCGTDKLREGQGENYFIECEHCYDTIGAVICVEGNSRRDAVDMWNRRKGALSV